MQEIVVFFVTTTVHWNAFMYECIFFVIAGILNTVEVK